ncbi:VOC family protein [Polaribacter sp.]|nr:VOC family protein [Polaribacter sp.]
MLKFTVNHIAISVKNVDESITFYQKVFQLKEIPNTASNSKTRWLVFEDGKQLHLIPRDFKVTTNKAVHFALSCNNYTDFVEHLQLLDIEYSDWINTPTKNYIRKDGIKQIYFQDPDNYWIEINEDV